MYYIHDEPNNVCHSDLKPDNLLVDKEFKIKIADFGCAAKTNDDLDNVGGGTIQYMAPERRHNFPTDYKLDDIFAAGIILFQMLAARHPFKCNEGRELDLESHQYY